MIRPSAAPTIQVNPKDKQPFFDALCSLPMRPDGAEPKQEAFKASIVSYQHPDHDTADWRKDAQMSAQAHPTLALRPMLPADAPLLAEIFRESVAELTGDDYSAEQQEAWAALADDEAAFAKSSRSN